MAGSLFTFVGVVFVWKQRRKMERAAAAGGSFPVFDEERW